MKSNNCTANENRPYVGRVREKHGYNKLLVLHYTSNNQVIYQNFASLTIISSTILDTHSKVIGGDFLSKKREKMQLLLNNLKLLSLNVAVADAVGLL